MRIETELLEEAERFLKAGFVEFEQGAKEGRDEKIRDGAEKAWNSIVLAIAVLLLRQGLGEEEIRTYRQKRLALEELSAKDGMVRGEGSWGKIHGS